MDSLAPPTFFFLFPEEPTEPSTREREREMHSPESDKQWMQDWKSPKNADF